MHLRDDWKEVLKLAWSVRFMAVSAVLSGLAAGFGIAQPYLGVNPLWIAVLIALLTMAASFAAIYSRIVQQKGIV